MKNLLLSRLKVYISGLLLALSFSPTASAAEFTVSCNATDLISTLTTANGNAAEDEITLEAGCIYNLTAANNSGSDGSNGLPVITDSNTTSINGNGATIQRDDAAGRFRILKVDTGATLVLTNLTIRNGFTADAPSQLDSPDGGGILNLGTLQIHSSMIRDNQTGRGGDFGMTSAGFGGNGGGIANVNSGELLISQSSITNNRTGNGGNALGSQEAGAGGNGAGISHSGNILAINTSTISYNETGTRGIGAGTNDAVGGGIFDGGETSFSIVNSTVSHNIASNIGGGIFSNPYVSASITIDHVTFGFNTNYALYSGSASAILRNSAFWGNVENGIVSDCVFDVDTTNSINNVFEQSGSPCGLANGVNNNITGGDTDLAPLADNGGLTHTHALLPSSQAIGHVPSSTQISDQRRVFRSLDADNQPPYNFNSDAGALEQIVITPITVNSSALGFEILTNEQGHLWEVFLNVGDRIKFEVLFTHATGDLLAQLLSKDLQTLWQFSNTSTDNEIIDFVATERGSYWIDVQGVSAATNTFDVVIELIRSDICFPVTTPGTVVIVCL